MLLIEAVRQTFISVSEIFYKQFDEQYVVFSKINVDFTAFCFPCDARIEMIVTDISKSESNTRYKALVNIYQMDKDVVKTEVVYYLYDANNMKKIEKMKAQSLVNEMLEVS